VIVATLLERQRELLALRTTSAFLVESVNGKARAWLADDLAKLEAIAGRLRSEFADMNGGPLADEILAHLNVKRAE
jgi:hypothetical protein